MYTFFYLSDDLREYMNYTSSKSTFGVTTTNQVIDGLYEHTNAPEFDQVCFHSARSVGEWWKVHFIERVAIVKVHFYNRKDCCTERSNNLLIKAVTNTNGVATETLCVNTGIMENIPDKIFHCETPGTLADEIKVINEIYEFLNVCEVIVYGWVL